MAALAKHPVNARLTAADKLRIYRDMVRIRRFEERSVQVYQKGKIGGFLHLYIGQEAVAAGTVSLLGENDHIITAYRDHGHALAVGMSMNECMAELEGKVTGCSKGKGGSMHYFAPDKRYWGGHGIVGGQIPLGTGLAFALKYKGVKGCCLAFMGDGAVNQGAVHEAYNLAALWNLPVVFIIENNKYSMGTSQARSSAGEPLAKRAEAQKKTREKNKGKGLTGSGKKKVTPWEATANRAAGTMRSSGISEDIISAQMATLIATELAKHKAKCSGCEHTHA
jgi:pyruvate dehydrogenase E1 component alpha subunit